MKVVSGLDARFLYSSTPTVHMHTLKVVIVDVSQRTSVLTDGELLELIEASLDRMPVLRRRILDAPHGLGNPVMVDDPAFDISLHLRHETLSAPGDRKQLDQLIGTLIAKPLARDRPLWEMTIVDGLKDNHIAFVMKLHHSLADGLASVALLENAFVIDPDDAREETFHPAPLPTTREHYLAIASGARKAARTFPRVVKQTAVGLRASRKAKRVETAKLAGPFSGPRTPFNVSLTADRTFATLSLPLDEILRLKQAAGISLNDAFLSLCSGGIRRYLERANAGVQTSLIASVPMATRTKRARLSGNHLDNLMLVVHSNIVEPTERAQSIHESAQAARRVRNAFGTELFELRSGLIPAGLHGLLPRLWGLTRLSNRVRPPLNFIASNVRGPREPMRLDGAVVTSLFSCGPILEGIGLNITAWSYADQLDISILGCSASLPDPWVLANDISAELALWTRDESPETTNH